MYLVKFFGEEKISHRLRITKLGVNEDNEMDDNYDDDDDDDDNDDDNDNDNDVGVGDHKAGDLTASCFGLASPDIHLIASS